MPVDTTDYTSTRADQFDVELSSSRIHELALNNWLYHSFFVSAGYPVPVVFATPMDAFSEFDRLFTLDNGPFAYLRKLPNEPYPSNVRYPLLSINRRGWAFRPTQNYSSHVERRWDWPTVDGVEDGLTMSNLASVRQERMASAWDFKFEINHYAMVPDTQALFVQRLFRMLQYSAGQPQVYILTIYPGHNPQLIRTYLEGEIQDVTEKTPGENPMVYRTVFNLTMEGYSYDNDKVTVPTVWRMLSSEAALAPTTLSQAYQFIGYGIDLRQDPTGNEVLMSTSPLPPVVSVEGVGSL